MHEADLWEVERDWVHCLLCPHGCLIAEGNRGICGVRENRDGKLWALTYAKVSSVAVDPIEKKPVFHFRPGTQALSLGSVGCSMRCGHCQNWQISRARPGEAGEHLDDLPAERVPEIAERYGCEGVAFTYNEPTIWAEYVRDTARACKGRGIYTVMVTNGFITEQGLDYLGEAIDVWRVDVKGFRDETVRKLCRIRSASVVMKMAERAKRKWGMHVEVVTNVVPTVNDDDETLRGIARWIHDELGAGTPWHVTRFMPYLDYSHLSPTPIETLRHAREIGREAGLYYTFLGNVSEQGGEDTVCPGCGSNVVERTGFSVTRTGLQESSCAACGRKIEITP